MWTFKIVRYDKPSCRWFLTQAAALGAMSEYLEVCRDNCVYTSGFGVPVHS